jgi:hypothetical protein
MEEHGEITLDTLSWIFSISKRRVREHEYRRLGEIKRFVAIVIENLMNIKMITKVGGHT